MLFIGHTRFSLFSPGSTAWVVSRKAGSVDEYRAQLYTDERLTPRCDVFLNFTLPMLELASRDHDFVHVVSFSDSLPEPHKSRLIAAGDRFPFLILDEVPEGGGPRNVARTAREWMRANGRDDSQPFGNMRLDDDDVLSADYFDQMAPYITRQFVGFVVTLARGITAVYEDGKFSYARDAVFPLHSKGHLAVCAWEDGVLRGPKPSAHIHSDRHNPVILDSRKVSHLWTRTTSQDGALLGNADPLEQIYREMGRYPEAAGEDLETAFPLFAGSITTAR